MSEVVIENWATRSSERRPARRESRLAKRPRTRTAWRSARGSFDRWARPSQRKSVALASDQGDRSGDRAAVQGRHVARLRGRRPEGVGHLALHRARREARPAPRAWRGTRRYERARRRPERAAAA